MTKAELVEKWLVAGAAQNAKPDPISHAIGATLIGCAQALEAAT